MPSPAFGNDLNRMIATLIQRVERLEAALGARDGLNIVSASGPFTIPNVSPTTPAAGVTIGVSGGQIAFRNSGGTLQTIPDPVVFNPASDVTSPASYGGGTAPGTYSSSALQGAMDAAANNNLAIRTLLTNLRSTSAGIDGSGIIA